MSSIRALSLKTAYNLQYANDPNVAAEIGKDAALSKTLYKNAGCVVRLSGNCLLPADSLGTGSLFAGGLSSFFLRRTPSLDCLSFELLLSVESWRDRRVMVLMALDLVVFLDYAWQLSPGWRGPLSKLSVYFAVTIWQIWTDAYLVRYFDGMQ